MNRIRLRNATCIAAVVQELTPLFLLCLTSTLTLAAEPDRAADDDLARAIESLDPVLVTATRGRLSTFETPYSVDSVSGKTIREKSYRTVPQILRDTPGVLVQETAPGQGSPFLRGFTSRRTLFLIDGIRLNNSVFRDGPNQYWATVDAHSIDRLEVTKGPSSVLYGSDAIGGTVQALTVNPSRYGESFTAGGKLHGRFASAENSYAGRVQGEATWGERHGLIFGFTVRQFGDLVAGSPVGTQNETGYEDIAGDVKWEYFFDPDTRLVLAYQHVRQNNVPRWHRTVFSESFHGTTTGNELQRDLDQERWLAYAQFHKENIEGIIDAFHASLSWHSQEEVRDRIRTPSGGSTVNRRDKQGFSVGTLGFWVQLESATAIGHLSYGVEYYHDNVNSFSTSNPVQGPVADDATYDLFGIYIQSRMEFGGGRGDVIAGVRFSYASADADRVSDPDTGEAISLEDDWSSVVGSLRTTWRVRPDRLHLFAGVSQGFRAPNLSDLTRFDSARSDEFEIPAPNLDAETYLAAEIGLKGKHESGSFQASFFYTWVRDQIVRVPTGNTNADGEFEITKANVGDGFIYGFELDGHVMVTTGVRIFGQFTYHFGQVDTFPTSDPVVMRETISRLMPISAIVGIRYDDPASRWFVETTVNMADKADKLSTRDQGDTQRIPPGGTPGYAVVHIRGGYRFGERTHLNVALENVFNKSYRVHGSGHNMPGTNFVVSVTIEF